MLRFEGETYADHFERVGEEDGGDACERATDEAAPRGFLRFVLDDYGTDLFVGEEFDGGVGEDAEKRCGVAPEETAYAVLSVDVTHRRHDTEPRAGIPGELRARGLEEDLDSVEWTNNCLGLWSV